MKAVEGVVEVVVDHLTEVVYLVVDLDRTPDHDTQETGTCTDHTREVQCLQEDDMLETEIIPVLDDA